jgi:hypothetical protein
MKYKIILFLLVIGFTFGCKPGDGLVDSKAYGKVDLREAGIDEIYGLKITSSVVTVNLPKLVDISTISVSGVIKIFEKHNSPFVNIERQDITLFKSLPSNAKVTRIYRKYVNSKIITEDIEITSPAEVKKSSNVITLVLSLLSFLFIYFLYRYVKVIKND